MNITLPWPPSINHYWHVWRNRLVLGSEGKKYRQQVYSAYHDIHEPPFNSSARLSIYIEAYPPDKRRRDIDNTLKAMLDALEYAGVYEDDAQIDRIEIVRGKINRPDGKIVIRLTEMARVMHQEPIAFTSW